MSTNSLPDSEHGLHPQASAAPAGLAEVAGTSDYHTPESLLRGEASLVTGLAIPRDPAMRVDAPEEAGLSEACVAPTFPPRDYSI